MIVIREFANRTVGVLGLGRTGQSVTAALRAGGATVIAWDDDPARRNSAQADGVRIRPIADWDWSRVAALTVSPGVPLRFPAPHPAVARARAAGCEVVGDVELFWRAVTEAVDRPRLVGITGTNGKSTTTALVGHALGALNRPVRIGANLGMPVLSFGPLEPDGTYVLEMSSYQLDLLDRAVLDIAVLLNISSDHLDRHGDMSGYVTAKRRIFAGQPAGAVAIIGIDDDYGRAIFDDQRATAPASVVAISARQSVDGGIHVVDGQLIDDRDRQARPVLDLTTVSTLPGRHNWQNAAAAYAILTALGVPGSEAVRAMVDFPGLPHRMEQVAVVEGVTFINDSKATNVAAAAQALACTNSVYWIAGGRGKNESLEPLAGYFDRIRRAYLIGEAAAQFEFALRGRVPVSVCGDLATAVDLAVVHARSDGAPAPTVLLSPACASFDQFHDFEARGDAFRGLVRSIDDRVSMRGGATGSPKGVACLGVGW